MRKISIYLLLLLIISLIGLWPFFRNGYFESHDGEWMVIRFTAFHQALVSGQIPVRFVDRLNNNYGYPVVNFLYPLPFYFAEFPKIIGLGFVDSIKFIFVASTIFSSILMFFALREKFSNTASVVGSVIYLYSPYRFVDLYVRGSLGESVAFAIIPLCLFSIFKIKKQKIYLPILSISTALLITSHNVFALLFIPLFISISSIFNKENIKEILLSFVLGVLITTFFWFPAIFDIKYVKFSQIKISDISDHLISFEKLIIPRWGYGPNPNSDNSVSTQIGVINLFIFIATIFLIIKSKKKNKLIILLAVFFIVIAVLMTNFSKFFWEKVPLVDIIQFPWRMLSIEVFISSIFAAYIIDNFRKKAVLSLTLITFSIIILLPYTKPISFINRGDGYYSTNESTTTVRDEYMPIWVKEKLPQRASAKIEADYPAKIIESDIKPAKYKIKLNLEKPSKVLVNTIFFPGWRIKSNGIEIPFEITEPHGFMIFSLPKGNHDVIIKYSRTPIHAASELISLFATIVTGVYFYSLWKKRIFKK